MSRAKHPRRRKTLSLSAAMLLLVAFTACGDDDGGGGGGGASDFPERPIRWIVAFDPGGGSDLEARRVQRALEEELGTSIQVEYREGGGGAVGWTEFAGASPDGYTVAGLVVPHIVIQPLALENPGYQTEDLRPVAWQTSAPAALLVAQDDDRFQTIEDFVDYANEHPGEVTVGGVETYSASDLALAQLMESADIDVSYVPITGGAGPLLTSLQGGHVDSAMLATSHAVQSEGQVRALAVAGSERYETLPDVPTFEESGYEVTIQYAWGVAMPEGVPDDIATKFGEAVIEVLDQPEVREKVQSEGLIPLTIGPDEAQGFVDEQKEIYAELVPLVEDLNR